MPRVTAYSNEQPFTPSPDSQRNGKDLPAYLAKVEKDKQDANKAMNLEPGAKVIVNLPSGQVEAVFHSAVRWRADPKVVVVVVSYGGSTHRIDGSRIGTVIRTKAPKATGK